MGHVSIGLVGCGTVGQSVVELLERQRDSFEERGDVSLDLDHIVDMDLSRIPEGYSRSSVISDIVDNDVTNVVVELVGGVNPAYTIVKRSLENGKHVVTANKALIAEHGPELEEIALRNNVYLFYEAAVGGGIPVINGLNNGLSGNEVSEIFGIVNGTTNFILTQMSKHGMTYNDALSLAQEKGFAEADPSFDVEGKDAAQKIAILASLNSGKLVSSEGIDTKGIIGVKKEDIGYAQELGYEVKLIAIAREAEGGLDVRVGPMLVPQSHPLASVDYAMNAIYLGGHTHVTMSGEGAGGMAAGSAVVSDIKRVAMKMDEEYQSRRYFGSEEADILGKDRIESAYFLLFDGQNVPGTLSHLTTALKKNNINVEKALQKEAAGKYVPIVVMTSVAPMSAVERCLSELNPDKVQLRSYYPLLNSGE
ncbi:homoserine dehydrogenase [Nanoarchaeota archaeon]